MNKFELFVNILETFIVLMFLHGFFGSKFARFRKYIGFLTGWCVIVAVMSIINHIYIYEGLIGLIFMCMYFLYSFICLKGAIHTKIFMSCFIDCIVCSISLLGMLMISIATGKEYSELVVYSNERIALIVLTKLILCVVCVFLLKFKFQSSIRAKYTAVPVIISVIMNLTVTKIMGVFLNYPELKYIMMLISVCVIIANVFTYFVLIKVQHDMKLKIDYEILQSKYEQDVAHTRDLEDLYSKVLGVRHDVLTHFATILSLIDSDIREAKNYILSLTQNQLDIIKKFVRSDNECLNAVLNTKIAVCDEKNIKVEISIMNHAVDKLLRDEIGILFGNIFDNAIEAAERADKKIIILEVSHRGEYLSILMKNTINKSVLKENKMLRTTKENKELHGLGIKNIRSILKKYDGIINYFEEGEYFCCHILT